MNAAFDSPKQIDAGALTVGYFEAGPADGRAVILLHGWPYDVHCYADVASVLAARGYRVVVPYLRGYGSTRLRSPDAVRNGEQAVFALDAIALMDALEIERAILGGFDWGGRAANIVAALWPERCSGLVSVSGYQIINLAATQHPLAPKAELGWWYLFYFSTERGRRGYSENRYDFNKLIWQLASPKWRFDDATYDRSASSFDNADHADIVIHNYRWRLGLAQSGPQYADVDARLQLAPTVAVPTITIGSDFDGPAADGAPIATSSQAATIIASSQASGTTFRRKIRQRLPKPYSTLATLRERRLDAARSAACRRSRCPTRRCSSGETGDAEVASRATTDRG